MNENLSLGWLTKCSLKKIWHKLENFLTFSNLNKCELQLTYQIFWHSCWSWCIIFASQAFGLFAKLFNVVESVLVCDGSDIWFDDIVDGLNGMPWFIKEIYIEICFSLWRRRRIQFSIEWFANGFFFVFSKIIWKMGKNNFLWNGKRFAEANKNVKHTQTQNARKLWIPMNCFW